MNFSARKVSYLGLLSLVYFSLLLLYAVSVDIMEFGSSGFLFITVLFAFLMMLLTYSLILGDRISNNLRSISDSVDSINDSLEGFDDSLTEAAENSDSAEEFREQTKND